MRTQTKREITLAKKAARRAEGGTYYVEVARVPKSKDHKIYTKIVTKAKALTLVLGTITEKFNSVSGLMEFTRVLLSRQFKVVR